MKVFPNRALGLALFAMLLALQRVSAVEVPTLQNHITDLTGVLSATDKASLEQTLEAYDKQTTNQFVVLIISSLEGESLEEFAMRVAEHNRIGKRGSDNGLLFLVVVQDRKMRFEVGYGLEGQLTDALTSVIIRDVVAPSFRSGDYAAGITSGMNAAIQAVSGTFVAPERQEASHEDGGSPIGLIIFIIIFILFFRNSRKGRGSGMWFIGGSGFGGGGFGGGGFSSGGFSGGGGSFGGGGSSGSW